MRRAIAINALSLLLAAVPWPPLAAQVCQLSVAGLNRNRRVLGSVNAECPARFHSAPFGNWGATSNFGPALNGHQFDGWCHDTEVCDNRGSCGTRCGDRWYEWNSCTDDSLFRAPNCSLYNAEDCTQQVSTTGVNVLGTQYVEIPVACPADSDGDGALDQGGCREINSYSHGTNFMSLYELDPLTGNELVQTLYFPETNVALSCDVWGCLPTGSPWVEPIGYDSPVSPPRVFAEMAMAVNSVTFLDRSRVCTATSRIESVSAASFRGPVLAGSSIVSAFGGALALETEAAPALPLPTTLAGIRVIVTDASQVQSSAPLLFVSPQQINSVMPTGLAQGAATIRVRGVDGIERAVGACEIGRVAPALFAANANGQGVAAAVAVRVQGDGSQRVELAFRCDSSAGECVAEPLRLGPPSEQLILLLFGTGIRGRSGVEAVQVQVGGERAEVLYAGPQRRFAGLDQVNARLPRTVAGQGPVEVRLVVDGVEANPVIIEVR